MLNSIYIYRLRHILPYKLQWRSGNMDYAYLGEHELQTLSESIQSIQQTGVAILGADEFPAHLR